MARRKKYVYFFGGGKADGRAEMKALLGGKGANLAEMASLGLPVPAGFTISTEACQQYYELGRKKFLELMRGEVEKNLRKLEKLTGKTFGHGANPLLVSVRSGAAVSMPGMMDTVLNLGLNDETLESMSALSGNRRFALDAYRRFIQMFGDVVMGIKDTDADGHEFNPLHHAMDKVKEKCGRELDTDLTADEMEKVVKACKACYRKYTGHAFPQDPMEHMWRSIEAVFGSWNNQRAITYRRLNEIRGLLGTAVNVQAMVFGNMGDRCGTGVAFTRDPSNGENKFFGEFLINAQGEDVVAGIRDPEPIAALQREFPGAYKQLMGIRRTLENHYRDIQDIEFTIEDEELFMLQTRTGKRTIFAAVKIAVDMVREKLITKEEALQRIDCRQLDQLFAPIFDPKELAEARKKGSLLTSGLNASPGAACGHIIFSSDEARELVEAANAKGKGELPVILTRIETSPEDIGGMAVAKGILTARGGMTSHAAVVARGMGTPCVAGAGDIVIDYGRKRLTCNGKTFRRNDKISIDGFTGDVYGTELRTYDSEVVQVLDGRLKAKDSELFKDYTRLMKWAAEVQPINVRTNADTPADAARAVALGAAGIGLCRTEHMFFEDDRIISFRRLILVAEKVKAIKVAMEAAGDDSAAVARIKSENKDVLKQYDRALKELLPHQRGDFEGIFRALKGRPCTIRLLDPPLHEFLPHEAPGQREMAAAMGIKVAEIKASVASLHEFNPMLGHRGCRLGLTYPEVSDMQVRAIIEAAIKVKRKNKVAVRPEIMIPLVGKVEELEIARARAEEVIKQVFKEKKVRKGFIPYSIGTMIEVPRAAVTADEIATAADFFSFGTNDLTQMGCGFSRDDAGKFLGDYVDMGVYERDPFQVLDQGGIGRMVQMAIDLGRKAKPGLKIGICGEHGGEPSSVEFCYNAGMDYVSCSPLRVPVARLALAQALLKEKAAAGTKQKAARKVSKKAKKAKKGKK